MEHRRYKNPPVEEAVCDIIFSAGSEWDPTMPGRLYELLKGRYPGKPRLQQIMEAQVQAGAESSFSMRQRLAGQRVEFLTENGKRIVGVAQDRLTVHMLKPYAGWDEFRPSIVEAFGAYSAVVRSDSVTRVGLRYINRIAIDQADPVLGEYFEVPPKYPDIGMGTRGLGFFNRKEAQFVDRPIRYVVTFADLETGSQRPHHYLLDLDIIWVGDGEPLPCEDLFPVLDDMKDRHRRVFEALITDKCRDIFDAS